MPFKKFGKDDITEALKVCGVKPGDTILVHSSLVHLGIMDGVAPESMSETIVALLRDYIGSEGTLAVLAPFHDYGKHSTPFDIKGKSFTKEYGVISGHLVGLPEVIRSPNPLFSIAAVGKNAHYLCRSCSGTAFGAESSWDRLYQLNAKIIMLGAVIDSLTFVRYIEMRFGVPYLYNKLFDTPVTEGANRLDLSVVATLRYMSLDVVYQLSKFEQALRSANVLTDAVIGSGKMLQISCSDCYTVGIECLKKDIYFFLSKRPNFIKGVLPFDSM